MSTSGQDAQLQLQLDALVAEGVQKRDVFTDVTSGSKMAIERPASKRLREYAEEGDTVVMWPVDRLGRSLIDVLNTVNLLRERGVHVRFISDGIDPATSTGRLMLNMLATLAEYERELIVERCTPASPRGRTEHASDNGVNGSTTEHPQLSKAMERLEAGDVLTVWKLDRLGRNTRHARWT